MVAGLFFVRDEFIDSSEEYKLAKLMELLPNWTWEIWALTAISFSFIAFFEGSFRNARSLHKKTIPAIEVGLGGEGKFKDVIYGAVFTTGAGTKVIQTQPFQPKNLILDCKNNTEVLVEKCEAFLNSVLYSKDGESFEPTEFLESLRLAWVHRDGKDQLDRFETSIPSMGVRKLCVLLNQQRHIYFQTDAVPVNMVNIFENTNGVFRLNISLCPKNAAAKKVIIDLDKRDPENITASIVEVKDQ